MSLSSAFAQDLIIVDCETSPSVRQDGGLIILQEQYSGERVHPSDSETDIVIMDFPDRVKRFHALRSIDSGRACPSNEIRLLIRQISFEYGIDPQLTSAIIEVESGFNPEAVSSAGAIGLMQLMPETASGLGVYDPWDPEENIRGGVKYFCAQLDKFGSIELALAAYNAGPGAVEKYGGIPPYSETTEYVRLVTAIYFSCESYY